MSKLKIDNIQFDDDDFVVEIKARNHAISKNKTDIVIEKTMEAPKTEIENAIIEEEFTHKIEQAELLADEIILKAKDEAQKIIDEAKLQAQEERDKELKEIEIKKEEINSIEDNAKIEAQKIIDEAKEQIEQERIQATNEGYKDGYNDAREKIQEELEEKLKDFDNFCSQKKEIEQKFLKRTTKDIIDIIQNISSKIILKKLDEDKLDEIIRNTIALFEKKEEIKIILSEKYAKMLFEIQKKTLTEDIEFNFSDFKQYENFEIIYNSKFDDDTIILENSGERFDSSLKSQLDIIIRNINENLSNKPFDDIIKESENPNAVE